MCIFLIFNKVENFKSYLLVFLMLLSMTRVYAIEKSDSLFKILKIRTNGNFYVINTKRNDSLFKIISKKLPIDSTLNLELLRKGAHYYLVLGIEDSALANVQPLSGVMNHLDHKKTRFFIEGDTKIKFTNRFRYRLYVTKNLIGLYYSPLPEVHGLVL